MALCYALGWPSGESETFLSIYKNLIAVVTCVMVKLNYSKFLYLLNARCGYDQQISGHTSPPTTAGVLGLGNGKSSILSQLHSQGLIRNVVGHCLSGRGGGFLFFGDAFTPSSGIVWTPVLQSSLE